MAKHDFDYDDYDEYDDEVNYYEESEYELYDNAKWYKPWTWPKWLFSRLMIHWEYFSGNTVAMIKHFLLELVVVTIAAWVTVLNPGEFRGWVFFISLILSWFLVMDMVVILALWLFKRSGRV